MSNLEWAKREVELACKANAETAEPEDLFDGYFEACCNSALKAFKALAEDGHSGVSINVTKEILIRLIDGLPLNPIVDTPEEWVEREVYPRKSERGVIKEYSAKRMSGLYKEIYEDGTVKYTDVNRVYGVTEERPNVSFRSGLIKEIIDEMLPITMPYYPGTKGYKVTVRQFLYDPANGDYDSEEIIEVQTPGGTVIPINRYFTEVDGKMTEVDKDVFDQKYATYIERKYHIEDIIAKAKKESEEDKDDQNNAN